MIFEIIIDLFNVLKFQALFSFCFQNKMLDIRAGNNKIFVRIASEEDPDLQKQSDFGLL